MRTLENILFIFLYASLLITIGYKIAEIEKDDKDNNERYRRIDSLQQDFNTKNQLLVDNHLRIIDSLYNISIHKPK